MTTKINDILTYLTNKANFILSITKGLFAHINIYKTTTNTARFALNNIHQNTQQEIFSIHITLIKDKKALSTNILSDDNEIIKRQIKNLINQLNELNFNYNYPEDKLDYKDIENQIYTNNNFSFSNNTKQLSISFKNKIIKDIFSITNKNNLNLFGSFLHNITYHYYTNSAGITHYIPHTFYNLVAIAKDNNDISGYIKSSGIDINDLDIYKLTQELIFKTTANKNFKNLNPDKYRVILSPYAVSDLLEFFSMVGFNGQKYADNLSFLNDYQDKELFADKIEVYDDGLDKNTFFTPFDAEGFIKKKVVFIKDRKPKQAYFNLYYANKTNQKTTGHAIVNSNMPLASNIIMKTGNKNFSELIDIDYGLWINRLNYIRVVDNKKTILTGMTRDGVYLVKNSKFISRVNNFRFTDSLINIFKNIEQISNYDKLLTGHWNSFIKAPSIRVKEFNLTGVTKF